MKPIDVGRQRPGRAIQTRLLNDRARAAELLSRGQTLDAFGPSMDSRALRELPFYARLSGDEDGGGVPYSFTEVYAQPGESNHEPITWAELPGGRTGTKAYPLRQTVDMSGRVVKLRKSADDDSYWFDYRRLKRKTPDGGQPCSGCGTVPTNVEFMLGKNPYASLTYQRTPSDLDGLAVCIGDDLILQPTFTYFKFPEYAWYSAPRPSPIGITYDHGFVAQCRFVVARFIRIFPAPVAWSKCMVNYPSSVGGDWTFSDPFPAPPKEDDPPPAADADTCEPWLLQHWNRNVPGAGVIIDYPDLVMTGSGERISLGQTGSLGGLTSDFNS